MAEGKYPFNTSDRSELRGYVVNGILNWPNNIETSFDVIIYQMMKLDRKKDQIFLSLLIVQYFIRTKGIKLILIFLFQIDN
jgi:hypothetical protein